MRRRGFAATVGLVVVVASASPATAQLFWSAGIELTAAKLSAGDSWVEVQTNISASRYGCDITRGTARGGGGAGAPAGLDTSQA